MHACDQSTIHNEYSKYQLKIHKSSSNIQNKQSSLSDISDKNVALKEK